MELRLLLTRMRNVILLSLSCNLQSVLFLSQWLHAENHDSSKKISGMFSILMLSGILEVGHRGAISYPATYY